MICSNLRFVFPALGGLLFGYDIGATSGATLSLQVPKFYNFIYYILAPKANIFVLSLMVFNSHLRLVELLGLTCHLFNWDLWYVIWR